MSDQNIQVFVRCRPLTDQDGRCVVEVIPERGEVRVLDRNIAHETRNFQFDQVFDGEANQVEVYDTVVKPLIDQVLDGFNCTVFAYGQTGTGKTYTMEGSRSEEEFSWEEDPFSGIIPRAIGQLFNSLTENNDHTIRVSFIELYNEDTYDLLGPINDTTKLKIYDDAQKKGSVIVGGLQEVRVKSKAEVFELFKRGSTKKQTTATLLNACSSRSHTIFSVIVQTNDRSVDGEDLMKMGKLNLVDLAGSENIRRSGAQDKRAREAGSINQSLLTLGRVITALVEKRPHVPYRESKLTRLLQDSIGGKTKTSIIATISPVFEDLDESLSTLEYASRAKKITNKPEMNQRITTKALVEDLLNENERLKRDYQAGLIEKEFKVRNEVAGEFKREMEKMKTYYTELLEKEQLTNDTRVSELMEQINQQQEEIKKSQHEVKVLKELADYRNEVLNEIQAKLQSREVEMRSLKEEIALLKENNDTIEVKKATRVRKAPVLEECGEYANMTFDGNDEITQLSAKKPRKKVVPRAEKRAINQSITCSGKKKKLLKNDIETELSPIKLESNTRVTRSRATRRKLNF